METTNPRFLPASNGILFSTVVPGTILAIVGSFLKWYEGGGDGEISRKGNEIAGVSVTILAIGCLLAAVAFTGLRGRQTWLLGMAFVLAVVAGAEAGNYVALIEQEDGLSTAAGLYMVLAGLGLAAVGSVSAFLLASLAGGAREAGGPPAQPPAIVPRELEQSGGPNGPAESEVDR